MVCGKFGQGQIMGATEYVTDFKRFYEILKTYGLLTGYQQAQRVIVIRLIQVKLFLK
jgi:hypothetical protein